MWGKFLNEGNEHFTLKLDFLHILVKEEGREQ